MRNEPNVIRPDATHSGALGWATGVLRNEPKGMRLAFTQSGALDRAIGVLRNEPNGFRAESASPWGTGTGERCFAKRTQRDAG